MDQYLTADLHINHTNIIKYCGRPFKSVPEMNEVLIDNINNTVGADDRLYVCGDFALGGYKYIPDWRAKINCQSIILIMGNHDPQDKKGRPHPILRDTFQGVFDMLRVRAWYKDQKKSIVLNHYAMRVWRNSHHLSWHCFGHSHNTLPDDPKSLSIDVGVDAEAARWEEETGFLDPQRYAPMSVDRIGELMDQKTFVPVDHHDALTQ